MKTEKINELISNSDLPKIQKNILIGYISRANDEETKKSQAIELIKLCGDKNVSQIILSNEDVKIYTISGKDEWDIKYPYRVVCKNERGAWYRCSTVSPSLDVAYLVYLENKYLGLNSRFTDFALKMLEIKIDD